MPAVSDTINKAKIVAQDTTGIRWTESEWLGWATDGEREIALIVPDAYSKTANVALAAGTKQSIPSDGVRFLEYVRYMGAGAAPGAAARKVDRQLLDSGNPNWHAAAATAAPQHYVFDPVSPRTFYVYPPNSGVGQAEIVYSAEPPAFTATSDQLHIPGIYANALLDYLLYRAYGKDSDYAANADRSVFHRKAFENSLGLKGVAEAASLAKPNPRG